MADQDLDQDLFIFTNSNDQHRAGKLYFVPEEEWRRPELYGVDQGFAVSIRDIFENGALLVACPMDDPNTRRVFYGANLFLIDKTRVKLREGGSGNHPFVTTEALRAVITEALREERGERSAAAITEALREERGEGHPAVITEALREELGERQPEGKVEARSDPPTVNENDLFLLATGDDDDDHHHHHHHCHHDHAPKLYRLPQKMYTSPKYEHMPEMNMGVSSVHDMIAHGVALAAMPPGAGTLCYVISLASLSSSNQAFKRR